MTPSFAMRVAAAPDVLIQELAGEAVLLNLKTEQYFGLDDMGLRMWRLLSAALPFSRLLIVCSVNTTWHTRNNCGLI